MITVIIICVAILVIIYWACLNYLAFRNREPDDIYVCEWDFRYDMAKKLMDEGATSVTIMPREGSDMKEATLTCTGVKHERHHRVG